VFLYICNESVLLDNAIVHTYIHTYRGCVEEWVGGLVSVSVSVFVDECACMYVFMCVCVCVFAYICV
jgi:hypothetical protein